MSLGLLMLSRFTYLLALALLLTGCAPVLNLFTSVSDFCPNSTETSHQYFGSPDADDLVIFIHGLCGDAKTTWTNPTTHFVFPEELARDLAKENQPAYVVAFDYVSRLQGGPSILSIADHLQFEIGELLKKHPYRRLRIVAHSMGGLVAREYILRRQHRVHPQLRVTNIVLLATPNNGSELTELGRLVSESRQIEELRHIDDKGNTYLESLNNDWNREFKGGGHPLHVLMYAGHEELPTRVLGKIVKLSSAILYADETMGFQQDHVSIAKPEKRDALYQWVKAKLGESLEETGLKLLDGLVQQGVITKADVQQRLPRYMEVLKGLQENLVGTELAKVLTDVKAGHYQEALALLAEGEPKERQLLENIAQRRFTQGQIHELQFKMAQAGSYYSQAVQFAPTNGSYRQRYGWFLTDTGDAQGATLQFKEVVRLSQTGRDSYLEGAALGGLGQAYTDLGQYDKAIECIQQALVIHRNVGNVLGEGNELGNLGNVYVRLRRYDEAIKYHKQALEIHRKIGDARGKGNNLTSLGVAYKDLEQYDKAFKLLGDALEIYREIGDVRGEGYALGNLGVVYANLGQNYKAIELYKQALKNRRKIGDMASEGMDLRNLGLVYADLGQYDEAIKLHEQALEIDRKIGDVRGEGDDLGSLGIAYGSLGQSAKAIEFLKASEVIFKDRLRIAFPWKAELERLKNKLRK
jgi:tetratricopeptide (TPR) repeat protein/pimeloyl-ACP methyl ester carboxylesterase